MEIAIDVYKRQHLNMDVNMCRLPDEIRIMPKFLVPLADIMWHPLLTDVYKRQVLSGVVVAETKVYMDGLKKDKIQP